MLLAVDTATRTMSIALHDGQALLAEQTWRTGSHHNQLLAPAVQAMAETCGITMQDLTATAVSTGPGSYTGLRIGVALAKGIATTGELPLVGVSSLDILAAGQPFHSTRYRLLAVLQAGRGRIIAGQYRARKGRWEADDEPQITTWKTLLGTLEGSFYVTGEVEADGRAAIAAAEPSRLSLTLVPPAYRLRRAGFLADEAWRRLNAGAPDDFDPALVLPVYLKSPG